MSTLERAIREPEYRIATVLAAAEQLERESAALVQRTHFNPAMQGHPQTKGATCVARPSGRP